MPTTATEAIASVVPNAQDRFMKTSQAARYLDLKPDTLKSYRKTGQGPRFHRVNDRLVLYRLSDLVSFVLAQPGKENRDA